MSSPSGIAGSSRGSNENELESKLEEEVESSRVREPPGRRETRNRSRVQGSGRYESLRARASSPTRPFVALKARASSPIRSPPGSPPPGNPSSRRRSPIRQPDSTDSEMIIIESKKF